MKEIRLMPSGFRDNWVTVLGATMLCAGGFARELELEDEHLIKTIVVVFTKLARGNHDYYTISPGNRPFTANVVESSQCLLAGAHVTLKRMYGQGFRYLHFEAEY